MNKITLTLAEFDALPEYSLLALKAGKTVTVGKRWKRREGDKWYMAEAVDRGGLPQIVISEIEIKDGQAGEKM